MNRFLPILIFTFLKMSFAAAQGIFQCHQVVATSGGSAVRQNIHFAWTVGETSIFTLKNASVGLSQGFHQPDLCRPTSSATDLPTNFEFQIFPNPTANLLHLRCTGDGLPSTLNFQIFNLLGRRTALAGVLPTGSEILQIDASSLLAGHYFLQVVAPSSGKILGTFRFVKI